MDKLDAVQREAQAAAAALDYFQTVYGFSAEQATDVVIRFIIAPTPAALRAIRALREAPSP